MEKSFLFGPVGVLVKSEYGYGKGACKEHGGTVVAAIFLVRRLEHGVALALAPTRLGTLYC